jgi:uncharacterized membrane protein YbhN (UPF0104 family)
MDQQQPPATKPRSRIRLIVQAVFSLALVGVLFSYLLKDVDLAQVWAEIQAMTWTEDAALLAIAAWNLATYGLLWMSVTPGLGFGRAMVMTQAASAVTNTVPTVGPAIGVGLGRLRLRSWETDEGERRSVVEVEADEVAPSLKFATATIQRTSAKAATAASKGGQFNDEPPF